MSAKLNRKLSLRKPSLLADQRGSALIVVLLLITVLTALVVEYAYDVYIDSSLLSNWGNAQRASMIAKSGQSLSSELINSIRGESYTAEKSIDLPPLADFGAGTSLEIRIEDENSRFNINSIIYPNGQTNKDALAFLKKLLESLNINPDISLMIADWIDPDSDPRLVNSELDLYNRPFWNEEELLLVEGIDIDTFDKIIPYITVFGDGQINLNTAEIPVLMSVHNDMTEDLAKRIVDYRESAPFETINQVQNVSGMDSIGVLIKGKNYTVKSGLFRITAKASVTEIVRTVETVVDSSLKVHFWRET